METLFVLLFFDMVILTFALELVIYYAFYEVLFTSQFRLAYRWFRCHQQHLYVMILEHNPRYLLEMCNLF